MDMVGADILRPGQDIQKLPGHVLAPEQKASFRQLRIVPAHMRQILHAHRNVHNGLGQNALDGRAANMLDVPGVRPKNLPQGGHDLPGGLVPGRVVGLQTHSAPL